MADTISQRYDVVYHALNSLGNDLPDPIGQPIQTASEIMSTLWTSGQKLVQSDNAWKLMVVMVRMAPFHFPKILNQCCRRLRTKMPTIFSRLLITFQRFSKYAYSSESQ